MQNLSAKIVLIIICGVVMGLGNYSLILQNTAVYTIGKFRWWHLVFHHHRFRYCDAGYIILYKRSIW